MIKMSSTADFVPQAIAPLIPESTRLHARAAASLAIYGRDRNQKIPRSSFQPPEARPLKISSTDMAIVYITTSSFSLSKDIKQTCKKHEHLQHMISEDAVHERPHGEIGRNKKKQEPIITSPGVEPFSRAQHQGSYEQAP